jgi:uncharacterized membrane protein
MELLRKASQVLLGAALMYAGISHLTSGRAEFQAQVPTLFASQADFVVLASGGVEIMLGLGLAGLGKFSPQIGLATAIFFIAVFWGNISQYVNGVDAFGLNSDTARAVRLLFQPLLVALALWSTGAWVYVKRLRRKKLL